MLRKSGLIKLILAVAFGCSSLEVCSTGAIALGASRTRLIAQPTRQSATERSSPRLPGSKTTIRRQPLRLKLPPLPKEISSPTGRRFGGARRTGCPKDVELQLAALVPATEPQPTVTNVWSLTSVERPILWFYTPYNKSSNYPADFELLDEESNPIYKTAISLPDKAGVIGVPLPPLTVKKPYRWFLNVYCDRQQQETPIFVEGVVQRVELSQAIKEQLQKADPIQQIAIYANNGIWHEAVTILAQLRQKNPNDTTLAEDWKELLTSVGLTQFSDQ
ncbi:DUF928 domain-containing protein [Scytonema sp. NUACC26]|uniref:DUF928 domain-containing protein n=1 Tax=Scytonema sp. NUACC26 TaxID=3140176 RepID=UPI0034DC9A6F